jgi:hypothetical protein
MCCRTLTLADVIVVKIVQPILVLLGMESNVKRSMISDKSIQIDTLDDVLRQF